MLSLKQFLQNISLIALGILIERNLHRYTTISRVVEPGNFSLNSANTTHNHGRLQKLLCWVLTTKKRHDSFAWSIKQTWAQRCDKTVFLSDENNAVLPTINVTRYADYKHLWAKTKAGFQYVYDHYGNDYDWFLKIDDDTYLLVENIRPILAGYDSSKAYYVGHRMLQDSRSKGMLASKRSFMSGGCYGLSKEALRLFIEVALISGGLPKVRDPNDRCRFDQDTMAEDWQMGMCMRSVEATFIDARDEHGRERFHMLRLDVLLHSFRRIHQLSIDKTERSGDDTNANLYNGEGVVDYLKSLRREVTLIRNRKYHRYVFGRMCCSPTSVIFSGLTPAEMHLFHYLIHSLKVLSPIG